MHLLSIDPGFDKTGYAVFQSDHPSRIQFITSGLIKTDPKMSLVERLRQIQDILLAIIQDQHIDEMVMEQLFFFKNAKTVIGVAQAQGSIMALAVSHNLAFSFLTPLEIKQIVTGDGRADKSAVWKMLKMQIGEGLTVKDDDESDAIAAGYAWCVVAPRHTAKIQ